MPQSYNKIRVVLLKIFAASFSTVVCVLIWFGAVVIHGYKTNEPLGAGEAFITVCVIFWVWGKLWKRFSKKWKRLEGTI